MTIEDIKNNYHYEKLSSKHDLSNFSCGVDDLDEFLKEDALKKQEDNLSVTYVAIYKKEIIGYVSITSDKIECKKINKHYKSRYPFYPAVKIGRLAVHEKYKKLGIDNEILASICSLIKELSEEVGIKFITIDAYFCICEFYLKNSFSIKRIHNLKKLKRKAEHDKTTSIFMYKDIKKIIT